MTGISHALVAGALVPRPEDVAVAAVLQAGRRLEELPLRAAETPVVPGARLTGAQQDAVHLGEMTGDVALRLALYLLGCRDGGRLRVNGAGPAAGHARPAGRRGGRGS